MAWEETDATSRAVAVARQALERGDRSFAFDVLASVFGRKTARRLLFVQHLVER